MPFYTQLLLHDPFSNSVKIFSQFITELSRSSSVSKCKDGILILRDVILFGFDSCWRSSSDIGGLSSSCRELAIDICDLPQRDDNLDCILLIRLFDCEPLASLEPLNCKDSIGLMVALASLVPKYLSMSSFIAGKQTQTMDKESSIIDKTAIP
jgi:hypothetical protein